MNQMGLFFMELDIISPPKENYEFHVDPKYKQALVDQAIKLKSQLSDDLFTKMMGDMKKLYGE